MQVLFAAVFLLVAACAARPPPAVPTIHVRAGAPAPRDGSDAHPFATIGDALATLPLGGAVLVAAGVYRERVQLRGPVALVGAGAGRTRLVAPDDALAGPVVLLDGEGAILRDLTVTGGEVGILVRGAGHAIVDVSLWRQRGEGLRAEGAELKLTESEVVGTGDGRTGRGVHAIDSRLEARSLVFRDAGRRQLHVEGGTAVVSDVDFARAGLTALSVTANGHLEAHRVRIEGAGGAAIYAARSTLLVDNSAIRDCEYGITAAVGSSVVLSDNEIASYRQAAISLVGTTGLVLRNAIYGGGETGGIAIVSSHGDLELRDNQLRSPGPVGVTMYGSTVRIVGNRISGARTDSQGEFGAGIFAQQSDVQLLGNVLTGNAGPGIALHLSTGRIVENESVENGGDGLVVMDGSTAEVSGNRLDRNLASGLALDGTFDGRVRHNQLVGNAAFGAVVRCGSLGDALASENAFGGNRRGITRCTTKD